MVLPLKCLIQLIFITFYSSVVQSKIILSGPDQESLTWPTLPPLLIPIEYILWATATMLILKQKSDHDIPLNKKQNKTQQKLQRLSIIIRVKVKLLIVIYKDLYDFSQLDPNLISLISQLSLITQVNLSKVTDSFSSSQKQFKSKDFFFFALIQLSIPNLFSYE